MEQMCTSCPICNDPTTTYFAKYVSKRDAYYALFQGLTLRSCPTCSTVFADPMPTAEELDKYYTDSYRKDGRNCTKGIEKFPLDNLWYLSRAISVVQLARPFINVSNQTPFDYLDIGAGYGHTVFAVKKIVGAHVKSTAVEPAPDCFDWINRIADNVVQQPIHQFIECNGTFRFNLVTLLHVLEHFRDPGNFLAELAKIIKLNAVLVIEVPHCPNPRIAAFNPEYPHAPHLFFFNERSLNALLTHAGMEVLHINTYGPCLKSGCGYERPVKQSMSVADEERWISSEPDELKALMPPFHEFGTAGPNRLFLRAVARRIQ